MATYHASDSYCLPSQLPQREILTSPSPQPRLYPGHQTPTLASSFRTRFAPTRRSRLQSPLPHYRARSRGTPPRRAARAGSAARHRRGLEQVPRRLRGLLRLRGSLAFAACASWPCRERRAPRESGRALPVWCCSAEAERRICGMQNPFV